MIDALEKDDFKKLNRLAGAVVPTTEYRFTRQILDAIAKALRTGDTKEIEKWVKK